jgi:hypothetical protein
MHEEFIIWVIIFFISFGFAVQKAERQGTVRANDQKL